MIHLTLLRHSLHAEEYGGNCMLTKATMLGSEVGFSECDLIPEVLLVIVSTRLPAQWLALYHTRSCVSIRRNTSNCFGFLCLWEGDVSLGILLLLDAACACPGRKEGQTFRYSLVISCHSLFIVFGGSRAKWRVRAKMVPLAARQ